LEEPDCHLVSLEIDQSISVNRDTQLKRIRVLTEVLDPKDLSTLRLDYVTCFANSL